MKDFHYLIQHFFTHSDFLPPASELPGTLFTPLHFVFEAVVLAIVVSSAIYVARRKWLIKPVFTRLWIVLVALEVTIITWDTVSSVAPGFDWSTNLSLYPCSIFMYTLPLFIWGKGLWKRAAGGYICTLGMLGALINFLYPVARLLQYSCISFAAFHTFIFHGSMLFACMVLLLSGEHRYTGVTHWWEMFAASLPGLLVSIPANLLNYSPLHTDYMYFTGQHFIVDRIFHSSDPRVITIVMYLVYLLVPALFYLPSWLARQIEEIRPRVRLRLGLD